MVLLWLRKRKRVNHRTRRDRTMRRKAAFTKQMEAMTDAYIEWDYLNKDRKGASYCVGDNGAEIPVDAGVVHATVVGLFGACSFSKMSSIEYSNINGGLAVDENVGLVMLPRDVFVASAFVRQGVVPCDPGLGQDNIRHSWGMLKCHPAASNPNTDSLFSYSCSLERACRASSQ